MYACRSGRLPIGDLGATMIHAADILSYEFIEEKEGEDIIRCSADLDLGYLERTGRSDLIAAWRGICRDLKMQEKLSQC